MARSKKTSPEAEPAADESPDSSGLGEFVRRMAYLGVGTAFATQETASRLVKDMKLPKEAVTALTQGVEQSREEVVKIVSRTMTEYLQNMDMAHLMKNAMDGMTLRVSGEVQFNYDPANSKDKLSADIKASAKPSRRRRSTKSES